MTDRKPGRPPKNAVASDTKTRVSEYRSRSALAGLSRVEAQVPQDIKDQLSLIAKSEGVSNQDATAALLQMGLSAYSSSMSSEKMPALACSAPVVTESSAESPIAAFFKQRKAALKKAQSEPLRSDDEGSELD